MKKLPLLGDITPAQFLRDYWHKKPLLIRNAIPGFKPLLSFDALAKLASTNHAESRLVTGFNGDWAMQHGPLESLPARDKKEWTMLVQGVNLFDAKADALLRQFRFIPDARLDDLMVSLPLTAAASVRTSIPTTCSCCKRRASAAGRSARKKTCH